VAFGDRCLLVIASYFLDGIVIQVFCRLYTRHYKWHQGVSNAMIGAFYNDVTPGASGGQVMQVYTMKKQGIESRTPLRSWSCGSSCIRSLIFFDMIAIIFEWDAIMAIKSFQIPNFSLFGWDGTISMLPLIIIGFGLNLSIIALLFLMSYSHKFHNFIMHYGIGLGAKLHICQESGQDERKPSSSGRKFQNRADPSSGQRSGHVLIFLLFFVIRSSGPRFRISLAWPSMLMAMARPSISL
jgi:uncharacterized membrane protein YbhN (UPF0104 family)